MQKNIFLLILSVAAITTPLQATYLWKDGRLVNLDIVATMSVDDHFAAGKEAFSLGQWRQAERHFEIITLNFPGTTYSCEADFYLGAVKYYLNEFDAANDFFTKYLKICSNPASFQKALEYKFYIAEAFANGARRRCFGINMMPKWACGQELALTLYDEVAAASPASELALRSFLGKAALLCRQDDYQASVDTFQLVIKRFPKHELTPRCFVSISEIYLKRVESEFQNPDLLALAELNEKKMGAQLPGHPFLEQVHCNVQAIREAFAKGLYDTGCFYEKKENYAASILYYRNALHNFPTTKVSKLCEVKLNYLTKPYGK